MRHLLSAAVLSFLFCTHAQAQLPDTVLAITAAKYQPDKVYLHYDKSSYYAGETVWFKAYVMEGLLPATESKTLYVDWIADNGTVLSHTVSPIVDAGTNGQFDVPEDYASSFIHVRAYTKWMLNFDTAFLYSKDIRILPKDPVKTARAAVPVVPTIDFFPEGGDLIAGVTNRLAFKANDQYGSPVSVKAALYDNKGTLIQSSSSVHDGMGSFTFTPQKGVRYSVKWTEGRTMDRTADLPAILSSGVSMQVALDGKKRIVTVNGGSPLDDQFRELHLVGTLNQALIFKNDIALEENGSSKRIIPTESLPSGILTLTLFDARWNAIAERITFINNHDYSFEPQMEVQHWGLGKRKRNEIAITIPDSLQDANLSISVTDAAIEKDTTDNIISHLLLTSDIKGRVYNPAYYFSSSSDSVAKYLDLVMLTNGWRRFKWEDIVKGRLPSIRYPKDSNYLTLSGKVFGVTRSQLSGKESIALLVKEKDTSATKLLFMNINPDGSFSDPNIVFFDTLKVYYSLKAKFLKLAEAKFMTERLPAPDYTSFSRNFIHGSRLTDTAGWYHHSLLAAKALEIMNIDRGHVMKTVVITTIKKPTVAVLDDKYASGLFKGGDSYQFDLMNEPAASAYSDIFSYLQGRVAGLQINTTTSPPSLTWRGGAPAVYLDEMQTDMDLVANVPVSDVAYVKVFRPPFMGGFGGANGAIAIYTRRGNDQTSTKGGLSANTIAGYTPIKQFYSPNYDSFDPRNDHLDIRTTLYWNPLVATSQGNKTVKLNFYNNDLTKSFRVVIEGITKEGLLTHYEQIME